MLSTSASDKRTWILRILPFILFLVFLCPAAAFAEDGDGSGGGSGENRGEALTLAASFPSDGQTGIPTDVTIELDFNKNICNVTELENNAECVHLTDSQGAPVAAHLLFPDTQVQRELRHEVFLQPDQPLDPNSPYRVLIDDRLRAKNGTTLDRSYVLTFTTGSGTGAEANEKLTGLGDLVISYEAVPAVTSAEDPANDTADASDSGLTSRQLSRLLAMLLIAAVLFFTVVVRRLKRGGR